MKSMKPMTVNPDKPGVPPIKGIIANAKSKSKAVKKPAKKK